MNNYNPYDPNQNYGDQQKQANQASSGQNYGDQPNQGAQNRSNSNQPEQNYNYSYQAPYQNVVNTTATPVTGTAPMPPKKKKETTTPEE